MSVIHKSNVSNTGQSLGLASFLYRTAAEIYADYAERVTQDGGTVVNAAAALSAIEDALNNNYYGDSILAISPSWGVKKSGGNYIKFYSLMGASSDVIPLGTVSESVLSGYPIAATSTGAEIKSPPLVAAKSPADGYMVSVVLRRPTSGTAIFATVKESGSSNLSQLLLSSTGIQNARVFDAAVVSTQTPNIASATVLDAQTLQVGILSTRVFNYFRSGSYLSAQVAGGALADVSSFNSIFRLTHFAGAGLAEMWVANRSSVVTAQSLSVDQGGRYA